MISWLFFPLGSILASVVPENLPEYQLPPTARLYHSMVHNEYLNALLVYGGQEDNTNIFSDTWSYSLETGTWSEVSISDNVVPMSRQWDKLITSGSRPPPIFTSAPELFTHNGTQFFGVFGGATLHKYVNDLYLLNLATLEWSHFPSSLPVRGGSVLKYYNEHLYVAGGATTVHIEPDFFRFHLDTQQWENLTSSVIYETTWNPGSVVFDGFLYLFYGWNTYFGVDNEGVYRTPLDSSTFDWELVQTDSFARDSVGQALVNTSYYMFGGYLWTGLTNASLKFLLGTSPIEVTEQPAVYSPASRLYHSMDVMGSAIYMFGGETRTDRLNDLWKFDTTTSLWTKISATNPPHRSQHASSAQGDSLIIWGGESETELLNDMYRFSASLLQWIEMVAVGVVPTPRTRPCIVYQLPLLYLYGGKTSQGVSNELWVYDTQTSTYTLLNSQGPEMYGHRCYVENDLLYTSFGTAHADEALGQIHTYHFSTNTWQLLFDSAYKSNRGVNIKVGKHWIVGGGELWGFNPVSDFVVIDLDTQTETHLGILNDWFISGAFAYCGESLYLHGGAVASEVLISVKLPVNFFAKLNLRSLVEDMRCSDGSVLIGNQCEYCREGFYYSVELTECVPCPAGLYNNQRGATSLFQCYPCPSGQFNPQEGARWCLDCPVSANCPMGTSVYEYSVVESALPTVQPGYYQGNSEAAEATSAYILYGGLGVAIVALCVLGSTKRLERFLQRIDVYKKRHVHTIGEPIILIKNVVGGVFTLVFASCVVTLLGVTIPHYIYDNVEETKTLVPWVILEEEVSASIDLTLNLKNYPAPCEVERTICDNSIQFYSEELDGQQELSCKSTGKDCAVSLKCEHCSVQHSAQVFFRMTHLLSSCTAITATLNTTSSIPDEFSVAYQYVQADDDKVFKGAPGTAFSFTLIPSSFENHLSDDAATGYHTIVYSTAVDGAMQTSVESTLVVGLSAELFLIRSDSSLVTQWSVKDSFSFLLITLIGSVSGMMGAIGCVMSQTEAWMNRGRAYIQHEQELRDTRRQHRFLKRVFGVLEPANKPGDQGNKYQRWNPKVFPEEVESESAIVEDQLAQK